MNISHPDEIEKKTAFHRAGRHTQTDPSTIFRTYGAGPSTIFRTYGAGTDILTERPRLNGPTEFNWVNGAGPSTIFRSYPSEITLALWLRQFHGADMAGINQQRRSFLSLQIDTGRSENFEELWQNITTAFKMLEFDMAELHLNSKNPSKSKLQKDWAWARDVAAKMRYSE